MTTTVSKKQDKKAANIAEAAAFVKERRVRNLEIFESNFQVGLRIYEENKDKLSPEEVAHMESEIERQREILEEYKAKWL
jgi:cob(I)alamin adenosyltransferase